MKLSKSAHNNLAIDITNVDKKYNLFYRSSFIEKIIKKKEKLFFNSLTKVNLKVKKGQKIGILGRNGAGKTTLLKIITGITKPTSGTVYTYGKVVSLMNLDAGFHPDLTGRENIFVNGILAGMKRQDILQHMNDIIKFSGIEKFINAPFFTYSAGMKFRLAFSIAVAAKCDILLMDEVFVVGDSDFQKKTFQTIRNLQKNENITTVVTSHLARLLLTFADTFYELDEGRIRKVARKEVLEIYKKQDSDWKKRTFLK